MKKLDSYVIREMIVPFLLGTVGVCLMFQASAYIDIAKKINMSNTRLQDVAWFIFYNTPTYLNLTLPVGATLGSALAMSRLARESELTAMRAAGARVLRVIAPITLVGLLISGIHFYMIESLMPPLARKAKAMGANIGYLPNFGDVKSNAMIQLAGGTASFGTVMRQGDQLSLQKVLLVEKSPSDEMKFTSAKEGTYKDGRWTFRNPYERVVKGQEMVSAKAMGKDQVIDQRIIVSDLFAPPVGEELTIAQLKESISAARQIGNDTKKQEVQLQAKFALPLSCFIFAFVAPVFAILFSRAGGFAGVFLSLGLCGLYYNAFIISTEILYKFSFMPGWLAAWITNILFALLGLVAIRRLE
ncbi:MAG TPA: LptF/LptG family permease [Fimbriimonas sp.]|nr:LptF/LptG family permease [Fimbriimonas sp.]